MGAQRQVVLVGVGLLDTSGRFKLEGNKRDKPLLNRATREYYVPGSTFKTFTMISAFRAGRQNAVFGSYPGGFKPTPNSRPIVDATGYKITN